MSVKLIIHGAAAVLFLGALLAMGDVEAGDRQPAHGRSAGPSSAWADLEESLVERGFLVDASSLISLISAHPDPRVRWTAVEVLGRRGDEQAVPTLAQVVEVDQEAVVREAAAVALGRLGDERGRASLSAQLHDALSPVARVRIANHLMQFGDPVAFEAIREAARSDEQSARLMAVAGLSMGLAMPSVADVALATLLELTQDDAVPVRREIPVQMLLQFYAGTDGSALSTVLEQVVAVEKDADVRASAARALTVLASRSE